MAGVDLSLSGLASGFDWKTLVDQLAQVERAPQQRLLAEQNLLEQRNNAYGSIKTELSVLQTRVDALKAASLFDSRTAQSSNGSVGTAQAGEGAAAGTYDFSFIQLATAAKQTGTANVGRALSTTNDVSALVLADAGYATAVTAGTFTVNGKQISIATTDTLQQVFDKISTATSGTVTGGYDSATDKITLSSAATITLGQRDRHEQFPHRVAAVEQRNQHHRQQQRARKRPHRRHAGGGQFRHGHFRRRQRRGRIQDQRRFDHLQRQHGHGCQPAQAHQRFQRGRHRQLRFAE